MNININELDINYTDQGSGKIILLLHGWGVDITVYKLMITHFSENNRVIALDLPGFGKSNTPKQSMSVDDYAKFVWDFCQKLDIAPEILMGHSFGGRIIIKALGKYNLFPSVKKVILTGSAGIKPKRTFKYYSRVYTFKLLKHLANNKITYKLCPKLIDKAKSKFGSEDYKKASPVMRETMVRVVNDDLTPLLSGIKVPTLLIWGENDTATPVKDGRLMESKIKGSGLVVLKNCTHYAFLEKPWEFHKICDSFLNS